METGLTILPTSTVVCVLYNSVCFVQIVLRAEKEFPGWTASCEQFGFVDEGWRIVVFNTPLI